MRSPNSESELVAFLITCSLACALTLFLIVRLVYRRGPGRSTVLKWLQVYGAFLLLLFAAFVGLVYVANFVGFITFWILVVVVVMSYNQYLATQRLALLELVALAAERQLSLSTAITAFGYERGGPYGWRAIRLAEQLNAGQPLSAAVKDRRTWWQRFSLIFRPWRFLTLHSHRRVLPRSTEFAAQMGEATGKMGESLRELAARDAFAAPAWHASMGRFLYLCWFTLGIAPTIIVFMSLKIGPQLAKIFWDFDDELPAMTQMALNFGSNPTAVSILVIATILGNIWLFVLTIAYMFGLPIALPLTRWFTLGMHRAVVLRSLAVGARAQRTLSDVMAPLIASYPAGAIRGRLRRAQSRMHSGVTWTESLRAEGLISKADGAVLTAAQRAGNLPWALDEMAESNERRLNYRLQLLVQIAFPLCVVVLGMAAAFFVVGYFLPIVKLITDLSG